MVPSCWHGTGAEGAMSLLPPTRAALRTALVSIMLCQSPSQGMKMKRSAKRSLSPIPHVGGTLDSRLFCFYHGFVVSSHHKPRQILGMAPGRSRAQLVEPSQPAFALQSCCPLEKLLEPTIFSYLHCFAANRTLLLKGHGRL